MFFAHYDLKRNAFVICLLLLSGFGFTQSHHRSVPPTISKISSFTAHRYIGKQ